MTENTKPGKKVGLRGHATRQRKPKEHEDLGVQPLPITPVAECKRKTGKPALQGLAVPSFAPADFAFNFEVRFSLVYNTYFQRTFFLL